MSEHLPTGHDGLAFEDGHAVPTCGADRGELAEVEAILAEAGYAGYIEEMVTKGERTRAVEMIRSCIYSVIHPPRGTTRQLQVVVMGYALGVPGMVSMKDAAREYGLGKLGKAAISKRVNAYCASYSLPPSVYMKSAAAAQKYKLTNQGKRKQ